ITHRQPACEPACSPANNLTTVLTMRVRGPAAVLCALLVSPFLPGRASAQAPEPVISPASFTLHGKAARQRLLVSVTENGKVVDRTRAAQFRSETPAVVQVSPEGAVTPVGDGEGTVVATVGGREARATVRVVGGAREVPVTFEKDVLPILARAGC